VRALDSAASTSTSSRPTVAPPPSATRSTRCVARVAALLQCPPGDDAHAGALIDDFCLFSILLGTDFTPALQHYNFHDTLHRLSFSMRDQRAAPLRLRPRRRLARRRRAAAVSRRQVKRRRSRRLEALDDVRRALRLARARLGHAAAQRRVVPLRRAVVAATIWATTAPTIATFASSSRRSRSTTLPPGRRRRARATRPRLSAVAARRCSPPRRSSPSARCATASSCRRRCAACIAPSRPSSTRRLPRR
jgi:hypothetical protein